MKKPLLLLAISFLFIMATFVADLTGSWKGFIDLGGNPLELTYKLKAEGEKLSGSIFSTYGEIPIIEGKITGSDFTFKYEVQGTITESKGKFYGDSIVIQSILMGTPMKNTFKRVVEKQ